MTTANKIKTDWLTSRPWSFHHESHTSDCAKLPESTFGRHTQSIAERCHLCLPLIGAWLRILYRRQIFERFGQRRQWRNNFLRWNIHCGPIAVGQTCCVVIVLIRRWWRRRWGSGSRSCEVFEETARAENHRNFSQIELKKNTKSFTNLIHILLLSAVKCSRKAR